MRARIETRALRDLHQRIQIRRLRQKAFEASAVRLRILGRAVARHGNKPHRTQGGFSAASACQVRQAHPLRTPAFLTLAAPPDYAKAGSVKAANVWGRHGGKDVGKQGGKDKAEKEKSGKKAKG